MSACVGGPARLGAETTDAAPASPCQSAPRFGSVPVPGPLIRGPCTGTRVAPAEAIRAQEIHTCYVGGKFTFAMWASQPRQDAADITGNMHEKSMVLISYVKYHGRLG
jgi:hypothetical protein